MYTSLCVLRLDKLGSTHTPAVSDRRSALREVEWRSSAEAEQCAGSASGDMTQHSTPWLFTGVLCRHPPPPPPAHFPHNVILRGYNTVILITAILITAILITVILITLFGLSIFRRLQVSCFFMSGIVFIILHPMAGFPICYLLICFEKRCRCQPSDP